MASVISILESTDLTPLISRTYTLDIIPLSELIYQFQQLYLTHQKNNTLTPVISHDGVNYLYVRSGELIILLVCYHYREQYTINVLELFTFLYKFEGIMKAYFQIPGSSTSVILNRGVIMDNFDLIYELFDEVMDFGIPQLTEVGILKDVIKLDLTRPELGGDYSSSDINDVDEETKWKRLAMNEVNSSVLRGATNTISWRPKGIFYPKNEIFVDLVEYNTLVIGADLDTIIRNEVRGEIKLRCYLSGMPVLKLQLLRDIMKKMDKDSLILAQFVDFTRYNYNGSIHFIPPDGESILLSYKVLNFNKKPLIQVVSYNTELINTKDNKPTLQVKLVIKLNVKIKSNFKDIKISLPQPRSPHDLAFNMEINPRFKAKYGKVLYDFSSNRIIWTIESFPNNEINQVDEISMSSLFSLYDPSYGPNKVDLGMNPPPKRETPLFKQIHEGIDIEKKDEGTPNRKEQGQDEQEECHKALKNEIRIQFKLQNETYTGLKIQYLKLEKEYSEQKGDKWGEMFDLDKEDSEDKLVQDDSAIKGYKLEYTLFPWIRYMSCSDDEFVYRVK